MRILGDSVVVARLQGEAKENKCEHVDRMDMAGCGLLSHGDRLKDTSVQPDLE